MPMNIVLDMLLRSSTVSAKFAYLLSAVATHQMYTTGSFVTNGRFLFNFP